MLRLAWRAERDLGDVSQHGERRRQLMGRVGGEPTDLFERTLQPPDHAVYRRAQSAQFIRGVGDVYSPVESGGGDQLGIGSHSFDRGQRPARQDVSAAQRRGDGQRTGQKHDRQELAQLVIVGRQRCRDLKDQRPLRDGDHTAQEPGVARLATVALERGLAIVRRRGRPRQADRANTVAAKKRVPVGRADLDAVAGVSSEASV